MENANSQAERAAKLAEAERAVAPYINTLSDKTWAKMNHSERTEALQKIANYEATVLEMPVPEFTSTPLPNNVRGKYGPTTNTIVQNKDCTLAPTSKMAIQNALHEIFHSYQNDCIQHPDSHPNVPPKTIDSWKQGRDSYSTDAKNAFTYLNNPLEVDARNYSDSRFSFYESRMNQTVSTRVQNGETINQILVTPDMIQTAPTSTNQTNSGSDASHGVSPAVFGAESAAASPASSVAGEGHGNGIGR